MAHVARIGSLASDLIEAHRSSPSKARLTDQQNILDSERWKSLALRTFANPRTAHTNQFEVLDQLHGLEEKFRVLNNDELADALKVRMGELSGRSDRWTPEVLSLLLQLSDKPVEKTNVEDLAVPEPKPPTPLLKWSDILAEDSLMNPDDIWDRIDYAANSSEEDQDITFERSTAPELTPDSSVHLDDAHADLESGILVVPVDDAIFTETINAQFWKTKAALGPPNQGYGVQDNFQLPKVMITEVQMIREVIFMLLGLPTSVFTSSKDEEFVYNPRYGIRHVSQLSIMHLLSGFTTLGNKLSSIRAWTQRDESVQVQQTFQAVLSSRMRDINSALSAIEARILNPVKPIPISLLDLSDEVPHITQSMQTIAEVITGLEAMTKEQMPFKILECLFDQTGTCQSVGDSGRYEFMAQLFFECFQTYLKPVRRWMETGDLSQHDQVMFVTKNEEDVGLEFIWRKKYFLHYDDNGRLHAPNFLHVAAKKIFTTGKSVSLLKELGQEMHQDKEIFQLDYVTVCQATDGDMLSPFSELLDIAIDKWIASMHHSSSLMLRNRLESQCGLSRSLDALEYIYFQRNGALSDVATSTVFDRIDRGIRAWNDSSILTERFQSVFNPLPCIDTHRLTISSTAPSHRGTNPHKRSVKLLNALHITYVLPWPIANILPLSSLSIYQCISTFLFQTHRSKHLLQRHSSLSSWDPKPTHNALTYSLRYRLLWFTNIILTYLTEIVLAVSTAEMRASMAKAEDVDAMIKVHEAYIKSLEEQCLISQRLAPIHQAIISLLDLAVLFSDTNAAYANPGQNPNTPITRRKRSNQDASNDSSSSLDDPSSDSSDSSPSDPPSFTSTQYDHQLRKMHDSFSKLLSFITAGLRGVSRAGGEAAWEILAEKLGG